MCDGSFFILRDIFVKNARNSTDGRTTKRQNMLKLYHNKKREINKEVFHMILLIIYAILGYWAVGQTIWANKIVFGQWNVIIVQRLLLGCILGFILIPLAILKAIFSR